MVVQPVVVPTELDFEKRLSDLSQSRAERMMKAIMIMMFVQLAPFIIALMVYGYAAQKYPNYAMAIFASSLAVCFGTFQAIKTKIKESAEGRQFMNLTYWLDPHTPLTFDLMINKVNLIQKYDGGYHLYEVEFDSGYSGLDRMLLITPAEWHATFPTTLTPIIYKGFITNAQVAYASAVSIRVIPNITVPLNEIYDKVPIPFGFVTDCGYRAMEVRQRLTWDPAKAEEAVKIYDEYKALQKQEVIDNLTRQLNALQEAKADYLKRGAEITERLLEEGLLTGKFPKPSRWATMTKAQKVAVVLLIVVVGMAVGLITFYLGMKIATPPGGVK